MLFESDIKGIIIICYIMSLINLPFTFLEYIFLANYAIRY